MTISRVKSLAVFGPSVLPVECEVELEDVHAGLAEESERAAVDVGVDQLWTSANGRCRTAAIRRACSSA